MSLDLVPSLLLESLFGFFRNSIPCLIACNRGVCRPKEPYAFLCLQPAANVANSPLPGARTHAALLSFSTKSREFAKREALLLLLYIV
jgi:hypothetical protein